MSTRMGVLAQRASRIGPNRCKVSRAQRHTIANKYLNRKFVIIKASSSSSETEISDQKQDDDSSRIKQTLADLDALLGIEEEKEEEKEAEKQADESNVAVSFSPDALAALLDAEAKREQSPSLPSENPEVAKKVSDSIGRIVEQARKLQESNEDDTAGEQAMRKEFEQLLSAIVQPKELDPNDKKIIEKQVFGPNTFWVTETAPYLGFDGGITVRGNFRGPKEIVFEDVCAKMKTLFGDKYTVKLVQEDDFTPEGEITERIVFLILPTVLITPSQIPGWQRGAATVLFIATFVSALQLGLTANIGALPKETLLWLSNPENINSELLPPGLENFDPVPFFTSAISVGGTALLPQLVHELGHAVMANIKGIKLGPSLLIPNGQLGTFGSITQLRSLAKNKTDLFDFAFAGLGAGGAASLALFVYGLIASHVSSGGSVVDPALVPVPTSLFQGSLLLGSICKFALGADAMAKASISVSPALIGGWCGLVATALNALPVGNLDGGRIMLAAYGKNVLAFSSLVCYIGLGLGLLGSSLALPFGLYILICQRDSEKNIQNEVSEVDPQRKNIALILAAAAVLILLPIVPDVNEALLMGQPGDFL